MTSRLTTVICVNDITLAIKQLEQINDLTDVIELRLDYLENPNLDTLQQLTKYLKRPYILTLRHQGQGGFFKGHETKRINCIKSLLQAKPDYVDLESSVSSQVIDEIHQHHPEIKIIRSFHDFHKTPNDLDNIFEQMYHPYVTVYKMITLANNTLDSLRMLNFVKKKKTNHEIIGHCMGEDGIFSRLVGAIIGNYFTYAALSKEDGEVAVKHQIDIKTLHEVYHLKQKNNNTQLYALLGNPICYSIGDIFHNGYFYQHHINALYVKIKLDQDQLTSFFTLIKPLPFKGFSITMPLKEAILPFVDNQSTLQAVNTLMVNHDKILAINTDGIGAIDAIKKVTTLKNKHILILGAGGAAIAIVDSAIKNGAHITLANRTRKNAEKIGQHYPIKIIELCTTIHSVHTQCYDIIINTLPSHVTIQGSFIDWLRPLCVKESVIMDINYNRSINPLQNLSNDSHCLFIKGEQMYINQALAQLNYWLNQP